MATIQKIKGSRTVLDSPYAMKWPEVTASLESEIMELLKRCIAAGAEEEEPVSLSGLRQQGMVIGINSFTRCLEHRSLGAGLVCLSAKPGLMTQHILVLSATRKCPVAAIAGLSSSIAPLLKIKSVLALGFKESLIKSTALQDVVKCIRDNITVATLPWSVGPSQGAPDEGGGATCMMMKRPLDGEQYPPRSKRLKEGVASTKDSDLYNYVPLQVKVTSRKRTK